MATATAELTDAQIEEDVAEETVQQKKNRLRNEAERDVLNAHRDELNARTEALFVAEGLKYTRRLTEKEKAQKKIEDLLNEHPDLREKYGVN